MKVPLNTQSCSNFLNRHNMASGDQKETQPRTVCPPAGDQAGITYITGITWCKKLRGCAGC